MQMPPPALGSALRSQKRPRLSSQGCSGEQLSPRWRAHTRQQEQSSSTARTPGAQAGGVGAHRAGHWVGQRWAAATWRGRDRKGEALSGDRGRRDRALPRRAEPLTCPRTWSSRKARQKHRLGTPRTLCMVRLCPRACTEQARAPRSLAPLARPAAGPARASGPRRPPRSSYSALAGRARAGWLRGRRGRGRAGWGMERTPGLPWQLAVGAALLRARPRGLRVPVCGDWLFPERREGQGGVARRGPRGARAPGKETPVCSWKPLRLPPGTGPRGAPPAARGAAGAGLRARGSPRGAPAGWGPLRGPGERPGGLVRREARASLSPFRALWMCWGEGGAERRRNVEGKSKKRAGKSKKQSVPAPRWGMLLAKWQSCFDSNHSNSPLVLKTNKQNKNRSDSLGLEKIK